MKNERLKRTKEENYQFNRMINNLTVKANPIDIEKAGFDDKKFNKVRNLILIDNGKTKVLKRGKEFIPQKETDVTPYLPQDIIKMEVAKLTNKTIIVRYDDSKRRTTSIRELVDQYSDDEIFLISDTHFSSENSRIFRGYDTIDEMDEDIIFTWNRKIQKDNLVIIVGDFSDGSAVRTMDILDRLNGKKILIQASHDIGLMYDKSFNKLRAFEYINEYLTININGTHYVFFHYPVLKWDKQRLGSIHIYGQLHSVSTKIHNSWNVALDYNGEPLSLTEVKQRITSLNKSVPNTYIRTLYDDINEDMLVKSFNKKSVNDSITEEEK